MAHGMPRLDLLRGPRASRRAYRERLLGPRADRPRAGAGATLGAAGPARGRRRARRRALAAIPVAAPADAAAGARREVAICMATYEPAARAVPPPGRVDPRADAHGLGLRRSATTARRPERFAAIAGGARRRPALRASRARPRRLGFYRNFERALALAPADAPLRRARRPGRPLAPGQARDAAGARSATRGSSTATRAIVDARRRACSPTPTGAGARNNHTDLLSLLVANAVTGAASLFPRDAARRRAALPAGPVRALPRPLARARRARRSATIALRRPAALRLRAARRRDARPRRGQPHAGAARAARRAAPRPARADPAVAHALLRRRLPAAAVRGGAAAALRRPDGAAPSAARSSASSAPTARCARARRARRCAARASCVGRRRETLGAEWMLAHALRLAPAAGRDAARPRRSAARAARRACRRPRSTRGPARARPASPALRAIAEKIAPLRLAVRDDAPRRVNLLIPTIDLQHFFGGYIAQVQPRPAAGRARASACGSSPSTRSAPLPRDWREQRRGLQRARRGCFDAGRGRVRPRVAGARGQPRRPLRRHDLVDRPHRRTRRCARSTASASST